MMEKLILKKYMWKKRKINSLSANQSQINILALLPNNPMLFNNEKVMTTKERDTNRKM